MKHVAPKSSGRHVAPSSSKKPVRTRTPKAPKERAPRRAPRAVEEYDDFEPQYLPKKSKKKSFAPLIIFAVLLVAAAACKIGIV